MDSSPAVSAYFLAGPWLEHGLPLRGATLAALYARDLALQHPCAAHGRYLRSRNPSCGVIRGALAGTIRCRLPCALPHSRKRPPHDRNASHPAVGGVLDVAGAAVGCLEQAQRASRRCSAARRFSRAPRVARHATASARADRGCLAHAGGCGASATGAPAANLRTGLDGADRWHVSQKFEVTTDVVKATVDTARVARWCASNCSSRPDRKFDRTKNVVLFEESAKRLYKAQTGLIAATGWLHAAQSPERDTTWCRASVRSRTAQNTLEVRLRIPGGRRRQADEDLHVQAW